jgi:RNA polymerase sigma-70 factor (ECF subfamily)
MIKTPGLEEQQAITRLKQGDLDGLEPLVRRYQVQAVYTAYLITGDMQSAEDIVQNAFVHAAQKIHQFDPRRPFGGWFLRSVANAAIKAAQRQKRFVPLKDDPDEPTAAVMRWLLDPRPGPEQLSENAETRRLVWQALQQLPAEQRAAIVLRHFLDMNESEMTRELQRPLTTIRWWLRTARNRLRELLRPAWPVDAPDEDERHV